MTQIEITHNRVEGTLCDAGHHGPAGDVLHAHPSWCWSRMLGMWFVRQSRDRAVRRSVVEQTVNALRAAGFEVVVDIDDRFRPTELVEADRAGRQEQRVDALNEKAARRRRACAAAEAADARAHEALPPWGEPVKLDHYSAPRHLRAIDRADAAARKARDARAAVRFADERAETASHTTENRFDPGFIARRIERFEEELRGEKRRRDGWTRTLFTSSQTGQKYIETHQPATGEAREEVLERIDELEDKLAYWKGQLEQARATGYVLFERSMVRPGDFVIKGKPPCEMAYKVVRVNKKTVSVQMEVGTATLPYAAISRLVNSDGRKVTFGPDGTRSDGR